MDKDEALKLAIGKIKSARDCHFAAIDPLLFEAEEILEQALAAPVQEPVALGKPTDEMVQAATDEYDEWAFDNKGTTECIRAMLVKALKVQPAAQPAPVQEPEYWNVLDPTGNVVASETDAIRGWARIAGSYKPTVEGLLGFHDQGWRVLPKITPPAQPAVPLTDEQIDAVRFSIPTKAVTQRDFELARAIEAAHGITKGQQ